MHASYTSLFESGELERRRDAALGLLRDCRLCPRNCAVDRLAGGEGFCRTGRRARVASFNVHYGEEAPLVGRGGSGTIFFSSCNLLCSFCQNFDISHGNAGVDVEAGQLTAAMLSLAAKGCHNINFVTPSHVVPQILEALVIAAGRGLDLPLVYNTGGYDAVETLRLLDGVVDIYMPDFKFWHNKWARHFCQASDYRERVTEAIREMHRQVGDLQIGADGVAARGLLIRHLVMPRGVAGTAEVMRFLAREISADTYVNVMAQYRPCGRAAENPVIRRVLDPNEYRAAVKAARVAGMRRLDR